MFLSNIMTLENKLQEVKLRMAEKIPMVEKKKKEKAQRDWLKETAKYGRKYAVPIDGSSFMCWVSNQYLNNMYNCSPKSAAVHSSAEHISGGITGGDSLEAPFTINYGGSSRYPSLNGGITNFVKNALKLLVTADVYRTENRLEESACLVECAKYLMDYISHGVGNDSEQREIHFKSQDPFIHTSTYNAIGIRALRIVDKCIELKETELAKEMYALAQNCSEQSKLPITEVKFPPHIKTTPDTMKTKLSIC